MLIVSNYQKLIVWQKAMALTIDVYKLIRKLPKEEMYALADQMRRAVVSIPSNIAEGCGRYNQNEKAFFLRVARGSATELETQLLICKNLGYLSDEDVQKSIAVLNEIVKMLHSLDKTGYRNNSKQDLLSSTN